MKVLAIDTSTRMGSIALVEGPHLVAEMQMNVEATHTERLLPAISVLFERTGWKISDLNGLALTIGPGSFTGLRIGLVTLKGFAHAHHLPVVGVSSLLALAHNGALSHWPVAAILDAKRGEVFGAAYQFEKGHVVKTLLAEQCVKPEIFCEALKGVGGNAGDSRWGCEGPLFGETHPKRLAGPAFSTTSLKRFEGCWLIGDGALRYAKLFEDALGEKVYFPPMPLMRLQAKWIAWLALPRLEKGEGKDWKNLTPNYLRLSDAEIKAGITQ